MADQDVQRFLDEEEAASKLVEELSQLRQETQSYQAAHGALSEIKEKLVSLVSRTEDLAKATKETITKLGDIGTPELMNGQRELGDELKAVRREATITRIWLTAVAALVIVLGVAGIVVGIAA